MRRAGPSAARASVGVAQHPGAKRRESRGVAQHSAAERRSKSHRRLWATPDSARQPERALSHKPQRAARLAGKRGNASKLHPPVVSYDFRSGWKDPLPGKLSSSAWDHGRKHDLRSGHLPAGSASDDLGFSHHPDNLLRGMFTLRKGVLPQSAHHAWPSRILSQELNPFLRGRSRRYMIWGRGASS